MELKQHKDEQNIWGCFQQAYCFLLWLSISRNLSGQVYMGVVFTLQHSTALIDGSRLTVSWWIFLPCSYDCYCSDMILMPSNIWYGLSAELHGVHFVRMKNSVSDIHKWLLKILLKAKGLLFLECEKEQFEDLEMAHFQVLLGVWLSKITLWF